MHRVIFTGELVDLINLVMPKHCRFDGQMHQICLFCSNPTKFFLVPGSYEHAYYAILLAMLDNCEKYSKILLQISNDHHCSTMEFTCEAKNGTYRTVLGHSRILAQLLLFRQECIGSLNISLTGFNLSLPSEEPVMVAARGVSGASNE